MASIKKREKRDTFVNDSSSMTVMFESTRKTVSKECGCINNYCRDNTVAFSEKYVANIFKN